VPICMAVTVQDPNSHELSGAGNSRLCFCIAGNLSRRIEVDQGPLRHPFFLVIQDYHVPNGNVLMKKLGIKIE
jgi:hypothetical protein